MFSIFYFSILIFSYFFAFLHFCISPLLYFSIFCILYFCVFTFLFYIAGVRSPPTSELAMKMDVPLPLPYAPHFNRPTQSLPSSPSHNATSSPLDPSLSHHLTSNQIPYKTRLSDSSLCVSTDKKYVQDSSIMATSMSEVKGWRNRRCIHIDYVLGCREGSDAAEEVSVYLYVCVCTDEWLGGWLAVCLCVCVYVSVSLSICLCACISACLFDWLFDCWLVLIVSCGHF